MSRINGRALTVAGVELTIKFCAECNARDRFHRHGRCIVCQVRNETPGATHRFTSGASSRLRGLPVGPTPGAESPCSRWDTKPAADSRGDGSVSGRLGGPDHTDTGPADGGPGHHPTRKDRA